VDLTPLLADKASPTERTFYWRIDRADRKQKAVRKGKWKYVRDGAIEVLFDLEADPGERKDVMYHHPEKMVELRQAMASWEAEMAKGKPAFVVK
jgi:arylsulfatase A-like enzyme